VNGVALDARGRLWIAEGDAMPPRFSVWSTDGNLGRLEREFFGPVSAGGQGAAVFPDDPEIILGAGCEWRIDPKGGPAKCLGVITRDGMEAAGFRRTESGALMLHVMHPDRSVSVFERRGEGDYIPRESHSVATENSVGPTSRVTLRKSGIAVDVQAVEPGAWTIDTAAGLQLGLAMPWKGVVRTNRIAPNRSGVSAIAQSADGKVFAATAIGGLFRVEITGLDSIRRLPGGRLRKK
jgi:hypothetical protein